MLEDYRAKIEKLSVEKLSDLADRYRDTITYLKRRLNDATMVGIEPIMEYNSGEIRKKEAELAEIEKLLQEKQG